MTLSNLTPGPSDKEENNDQEEKTWDNPKNPEVAKDQRDEEQLKRLKEEAERRKENLSENGDKEKNKS